MKIKNNTNIPLVIYVGYVGCETPEICKKLSVGEEFDLPEGMSGIMSIQEK
jgi:hypothetical protein